MRQTECRLSSHFAIWDMPTNKNLILADETFFIKFENLLVFVSQ
jgi:hypothetical protein